MQGSYTWAKSHGNTEGGVKSDIGQDDTGTTQDFDYPELTIGSLGYLPNDRRHSFKLFGNYELTDEWSVGANLLVQSGRPINCFGFLGGTGTAHYANGYFSCEPEHRRTCRATARGNNGFDIVPRGSRGRTEWSRTLDLNVACKPNLADGHLTFKVDVFNVFNEHAVTTVVEQGENAAGDAAAGSLQDPDGLPDAAFGPLHGPVRLLIIASIVVVQRPPSGGRFFLRDRRWPCPAQSPTIGAWLAEAWANR